MKRSALSTIIVGIGAMLILAACGASVRAQPPEVVISAADYSFDAPDSIPAGMTRLTFRNLGKEVHHAQLVRINDGVSFDQFQQAMQDQPEHGWPMTWTGGAASIDPEGNASVTLDLEPGQYALLCFVPAPDGVPHLAKGMVRPIRVARSGETPGSAPQADLSITMADFHFNMPSELNAGPQVWKVINEGPQPHELSLLKLAPGKTPQDVAAWAAKPGGPPPFASIGGMQALDPGRSGYINLELQPGNYMAVCFVPDPDSKQPHIELGMASQFSVK